MKSRLVLIALVILSGAILLAGCTQSQAPPVTPAPTTPAPTTTAPAAPAPMTTAPAADTVRVTANPQYGQILTDGNGRTVYYFTKDAPGAGTSACTGGCLELWPAFYAEPVRVSSPLKASDFGEITRATGGKQTTYMGWPLYHYALDTAPGDTKGYGVLSLWYVMSPTGVMTLAPTTTVPTTVPTTVSSGGGGY